MNKHTAGFYATPIENYPLINEKETLHGALCKIKEALHRSGKGGAWSGQRMAIVVSDHNEPVGLVTVKDILKAV